MPSVYHNTPSPLFTLRENFIQHIEDVGREFGVSPAKKSMVSLIKVFQNEELLKNLVRECMTEYIITITSKNKFWI